MQKKLRLIVNSSKLKVTGIGISKENSIIFSGCYFKETRSGNSIILTSGTHINPTKQDVINYKFEDVRIQA